MNRSLLLVIIFSLSAAGIGLYITRLHKTPSSAASTRIAIFEPASHPAIDEIARGISETIKKNGHQNYVFDRYNANGNKTLQRAQAEEIIQQNYDLITSIGSECTRLVHELSTKKHLTTPIVFTAVSNPVSLGVVASMESSGNNVTGIEDVAKVNDQLMQLLRLAPQIKNVLVVYDPVAQASAHEKTAAQIKQFLDAQGVQTQYAKVFQTNELQAKVQPLLENVDAIIILTDHTVVAGIDALISLCNRYGIILYASDLNSGDKGAALSYGVTQYDLGAETGRLTLRILEKNEKPTDIPIVLLDKQTLKINTKTMEQQGLHLSPQQLDTIKQQGGIIL